MQNFKELKIEFGEHINKIFPFENKKLKISRDGGEVFCKTDFGLFCFFFAASDWGNEYEISFGATIGFRDVFTLYQKFQKIKLGSSYSHLVYNMKELDTISMRDYFVRESTDIEAIKNEVALFYKKVLSDFFSKFSSNNDLHKHLNSNPTIECLWAENVSGRYIDGIIIAKIVGENYHELSEKYKDYQKKKWNYKNDEPRLVEIDELVEFLDRN